MRGISRDDLALSEIKQELDSALIKLETRLGLAHDDQHLIEAREAGDRLFSTSLKRKFNNLLGEDRMSFVELIEEDYWRGKER